MFVHLHVAGYHSDQHSEEQPKRKPDRQRVAFFKAVPPDQLTEVLTALGPEGGLASASMESSAPEDQRLAALAVQVGMLSAEVQKNGSCSSVLALNEQRARPTG